VSRFSAGAASTALAGALVGVAIAARGGTALERTGTVELLIVAAGAAAVVAALLLAPRERIAGAWAVAAFAVLALITALSIGWSIDENASFVETGRTLAYLAAFAGAVAGARLAPRAGPAVVRAVLLAAVAIAAYGLAARIWPGSFDESVFSGRIGQPFDYWNALAGAAAVGIVPALWLGARRSGRTLARALAYPAAGLLIATVLIAQSRGALLGAAVACALWVALVPLRLRSLVVLGVSAAGAAPVIAWALSKDAFRLNLQPETVREAVAADFGWLLALTLVGLTIAGLVVGALQARYRPAPAVRVRTGQAFAAVAAAGALVLIGAVAASERGLAGTVSDRVEDFTSQSSGALVGGGRLASTSSSRAGYWGEAWSAFEERPAVGLGAGSFELARLRYRDDGFQAAHAHGFVHQTLADLGVAGLLAALALLACWLASASRATGIGPRRWTGRPAWTDERGALVALSLAAAAYGVQSFADWTWFVPGLTVLALVAAGFVAGRGGLPDVGATATPAAARTLRPTPVRLAAAAATVLLALLCAWTIWQPVAADRAVARSYALLDENRPRTALAEAEDARDHNPYAKDPLYAKADALADMGRLASALRTYAQVAREHPRDPDPWVRIATFQLYRLDDPARARETVSASFTLDEQSQALSRVLREAEARLRADGAP
jgi:tetratricopeptide (TPR) repeat protein